MSRFLCFIALLLMVNLSGEEIFNSSQWAENGETAPSGWIFHTYRGASKITLHPGKTARIHTDKTASGYVGKRGKVQWTAGTIIEIKGRYRTNQLMLAENGLLRLNVDLNTATQGAKRCGTAINLPMTDEWRDFSVKYTTPMVVNDFFVFFQLHAGHGTVELRDLTMTVTSGNRGIIGKDKTVVWKESEDCMSDGASLTYGIFSGRGGYYIDNGTLRYRFQVASEVDADSLLPKSRTLYGWGRMYGYKDYPKVQVTLDRKKIYEFATETHEKELNGTWQGNYYWQRLGNFKTEGGAHELSLQSDGRMFLDALIFTDDMEYVPDQFEAREKSDAALIADLKTAVSVQPEFRINSIAENMISPLTFRFVTPGNQVVSKPGILRIRFPENIEVRHVSSHWAGTNWKSTRASEVLKYHITPAENGYRVCEVQLSCVSLTATVFVQRKAADSAATTPLQISYSFEMDNMSQPWDNMMLIPIEIPRTESFKKIRIGPSGGNFRGFFSDCPELLRQCEQTGINLLIPWNLSPSQYPEMWENFSREAKERNIAVFASYSPRHLQAPAEERAIDMNGKLDRKPSLLMRPDSAWNKNEMEAIAELARYVDTIVFDDENTNLAGDRIDYHPELLKLFNSSVPVTEIVGNKEKYAAEYARWVDFKCEMLSRHYELYRKAAQTHNPNARIIPQIVSAATPEGLRQQSFWDYRKLLNYVDQISPMIYTYQGIMDSARVGDIAANHNREAGRAVVIPTLLVEHDGFGQIPLDQKPMYKYQIWECLMERADTILFWITPGFFNAVNWAQISSAIQTALPYEEFFLTGTPFKLSGPKWLRLKALKKGNRLLIYAANYRNASSPATDIALPDGQTLKIDFADERARFYLVELKNQ